MVGNLTHVAMGVGGVHGRRIGGKCLRWRNTGGEKLMRTAIAEFAKRPPWGTAPFARTVLTGADPCASSRSLAATHRVVPQLDESGLNVCTFTMDATPDLELSTEYADPTKDMARIRLLAGAVIDEFGLGW